MAKKQVDGAAADAPAVPTAPPKSPRLKTMFDELQSQKAKLVEELQPYRLDYERLTNDPRLVECRNKIKELNAKIGPIDNELAVLARGMGGKSLSAKPEEPK